MQPRRVPVLYTLTAASITVMLGWLYAAITGSGHYGVLEFGGAIALGFAIAGVINSDADREISSLRERTRRVLLKGTVALIAFVILGGVIGLLADPHFTLKKAINPWQATFYVAVLLISSWLWQKLRR